MGIPMAVLHACLYGVCVHVCIALLVHVQLLGMHATLVQTCYTIELNRCTSTERDKMQLIAQACTEVSSNGLL